MPLAEQFKTLPDSGLTHVKVETPAFIYDESRILDRLKLLSAVRESQCRVLYSIKALSCIALLETISRHVDGFSVSSLFEYQLAREVLNPKSNVHITSPGLTQPILDVVQDSDTVSFNSLSQWQRLKSACRRGNFGLRINPERSYVKDDRYNPCRSHSKLGVPLNELKQHVTTSANALKGISGIHIHNNCESSNFSELAETVGAIRELLSDLPELRWINLGGGYLFEDANDLEPLAAITQRLAEDYGLQVFFEPGKAIVGDAGFLVTSVTDMFENNGKMIVVLDTTINHLPEVFEYQYRPVILEESVGGSYTFRLAGASCLSGDLFGDYTFDKPLEIGSRITFARVGAYMQVKANMFNGINLPSVYSMDSDKKLQLQKEYDYSDYRNRL